MARKINFIFFDLDHTLWDFESNSKIALKNTFEKFVQNRYPLITYKNFEQTYEAINLDLWDKYRKKLITVNDLKMKRFKDTFEKFDVRLNDSAIEEINEFYLYDLSEQSILIEHTEYILEKLSEKYELGILTNGFKETQIRKMKNSGIDKYFSVLVSSDEANAIKPDKKIFDYAVNKTKHKHENILYIGDDLKNDIIAGKEAGLQGIWLNILSDERHPEVETVLSLKELENLL
jgi:putative hydrolase of the HAD superfamily